MICVNCGKEFNITTGHASNTYCSECLKKYSNKLAIGIVDNWNNNTNYGWICPKCGRSNSACVNSCSCSKSFKITCECKR
jgi:hypothetical protein